MATTPIDDLIEHIREQLEQVRERYAVAQDATNTLVRLQVAQGLAATFLERFRPYRENKELSSWIEQGILKHAAFLQKSPELLRFYKRLLVTLDAQRILEIGVKGGGSTAFWKQLFPSATVVGLDLKLRRWLTQSGDGVMYVEGDQSDATQLEALATTYGPFDLVVDDGSHMSNHQVTSMRALFGHVRTGGLYVIEDIHQNLEPDKGEDIWPDFIATIFQKLRGGPVAAASTGAGLALEVLPRTDDLVVNARAVAIRAK